jgi:hypothetical protein
MRLAATPLLELSTLTPAMISLSRPFWDHRPLSAAPGAHFLTVGDNAILFDEGAQRIFELNDSSEAIWGAIGVARTIAGAAALLGDGGAPDAVLEHVRAAVAQWLERGLLRPADPPVYAGGPTEVRLAWRTCRVGLRLFGAIDPEPPRDIFAALRSVEAPDDFLDIREMGGVIFITGPDGQGCARAPQAWIPEVKARLTARMLQSTTTGFLAHAALLSRGGEGVLICGDPGAGKTTLSVSLLSAGFGYHSDDIVWIGEGGEAVGAPFAPAIKAGGWPLLEEMAAGVATSATYLRSDGQQVRYLLPPAHDGGQVPLRIGSILLLARGEGNARVETVTPLEVLTGVLSSAYSVRRAISATGLESLVDVIGKARIGRLCFSDWRDGRRLVEAFAA